MKAIFWICPSGGGDASPSSAKSFTCNASNVNSCVLNAPSHARAGCWGGWRHSWRALSSPLFFSRLCPFGLTTSFGEDHPPHTVPTRPHRCIQPLAPSCLHPPHPRTHRLPHQLQRRATRFPATLSTPERLPWMFTFDPPQSSMMRIMLVMVSSSSSTHPFKRRLCGDAVCWRRIVPTQTWSCMDACCRSLRMAEQTPTRNNSVS